MVALTIVIDIVQYAVGSSGRETGGLNAGQKKRSIKKLCRIGCCIFATRQAGDMQSQLSPIYCDWLESAFLFYLEMNRSVSGFAGPDSEDSSSLTDTPYAKCVEQLWTTFIGIVDSSMLKCIVDSNKARENLRPWQLRCPTISQKRRSYLRRKRGAFEASSRAPLPQGTLSFAPRGATNKVFRKTFRSSACTPTLSPERNGNLKNGERKARLVGHLHEDWLKRCRLHASEIYRQLRLDTDYSLREKDDDNRAARSPPSEPTSACSEVCKFWLARANDAVYYLRGGNARRTVEFIREEMLAGILYDILSRCRICTAGALRLQRDLAEYRHTDDAIVSAAKTATTLSWNKSIEALSKPLLFSLEQLTHICGLFAADGEDPRKNGPRQPNFDVHGEVRD